MQGCKTTSNKKKRRKKNKNKNKKNNKSGMHAKEVEYREKCKGKKTQGVWLQCVKQEEANHQFS